MKIIYGITKSNFGGAQRYVFDLACEAKRRGHDVAVLCGGEGELVRRLEAENIRVIPLPSLGRNISLIKDFKEFVTMVKILSRENPNVFHVNSSKMGGLGAVAARLAGVGRIIFTAHGWEFNAPRPRWQKILIKFFSWLIVFSSHETICVSEKTKKDMADLPFIEHKIKIIHNGVDEFELKERAEARKKLGVADDELVVGTLAELHRVKGLDILLQAWQVLLGSNTGKLLILGRGEEQENLQNTAQQLGISESVKFLGFVENARTLLSGFDIFVLPSRSEALPYAVLESGYASLPTVASLVGGIPEIITNNENGFLVEPENSSNLAEKLQLLIRDHELRERFGKNLKKTILEKFSKEQMFEKTFSSYQS